MRIPADSLLIEGSDITINQSELTGESDTVERAPLNNENHQYGVNCTLLAQSLVSQGNGKALVIAVGKNTIAGVITEKTLLE